MQTIIKKTALAAFALAMLSPILTLAQEGEEKGKTEKDLENIIITRKGNTDEKIVIEITADKILVNGKDAREIENENMTIQRHKVKDVWALGESFNGIYAPSLNRTYVSALGENRALLGVTTDKNEKGAEIQAVTKESGAEKAGLKKGDIITKLGDKTVKSPDDLTMAIKAYKPGDKVSISIIRDKKEMKLDAELGKWKGVATYSFGAGGQNFNFDMGELGLDSIYQGFGFPRAPRAPRAPLTVFGYSSGGSRLGMSVQETEDGKGLNVLNVEEDGNAHKAGVEEGDIITEVNGKSVNSTEEIAKLIRDREQNSFTLKLLRDGKSKTIEVKIPKKLKSANL